MTSSLSANKKQKKDPPEDSEDTFDPETQKALEEIDACQHHIDRLSERASEDILKVEQKYNKYRKPCFKKRNQIIKKIANFWITSFENHPQMTTLIDEEEEDCLHYINELEVEEFEDIKSGYKINIYFNTNPYFENTLLCKEFHLSAQVPYSKNTPIRWKEGHNLVELIREKNPPKQGRKRRVEQPKSFFVWFTENCDPTTDEIAEVIKDDLWPNPLQYYLVPEIDIDANGIEDYDDQMSEEADDSVVVVEEVDEDDDEIVVEDDEDVSVGDERPADAEDASSKGKQK